MRDAIVPLLIASHCELLILKIFIRLQLKRFLERTPEIRSDSDLQRYRDVVAIRMRLSLVAFAVIVFPLIIGVVGLAAGSQSLVCFGLFAILPLFANSALIGVLSGPASQATKLKVADDRLQSGVDATVDTWRNKQFPNWKFYF
jgi:hypothetical protein